MYSRRAMRRSSPFRPKTDVGRAWLSDGPQRARGHPTGSRHLKHVTWCPPLAQPPRRCRDVLGRLSSLSAANTSDSIEGG
eukprot:scaffold47486_cov26-Tisochrysis_lutea.AAC.4